MHTCTYNPAKWKQVPMSLTFISQGYTCWVFILVSESLSWPDKKYIDPMSLTFKSQGHTWIWKKMGDKCFSSLKPVTSSLQQDISLNTKMYIHSPTYSLNHI
jgi:hypothetical protein